MWSVLRQRSHQLFWSYFCQPCTRNWSKKEKKGVRHLNSNQIPCYGSKLKGSKCTISLPDQPYQCSRGQRPQHLQQWRWLIPCCSLHPMMLYHPCSEIWLLWILFLHAKLFFFAMYENQSRNWVLNSNAFSWFWVLARINNCMNAAYEKSFINKHLFYFFKMHLPFLLVIKDCVMSRAFLRLL